MVSFVIPTHNSSRSIAKAIQSILDNRFDSEIIIVDDNSQDVDVLNTIALAYSNVTVIARTERGNAAISRNIGIDAAIGEIIFLLDSDDYIESNHIANRIELHKKFDFLYGDFLIKTPLGFKQRNAGDLKNQAPEAFLFSSSLGDFRTSTISFVSSIKQYVKFDELQHKHQDWGLLFVVAQRRIQIKYDANPSVVIDETPKNRMSAKMDLAASLYFYKTYLSKCERRYQNRFCKFLVGSSLKLNDFLSFKLALDLYKFGTGQYLLDLFKVLISVRLLNTATFFLPVSLYRNTR